MDSVRSAALGFWIGTGSAGEDDSRAGLSHLIEHMLFRGTDRYGSLEIDQLFDAMGAEPNAGTGKETTSVYSRVLDVHLERAFDVMADMVLAPKFDGGDLDNEREIVLEELAGIGAGGPGGGGGGGNGGPRRDRDGGGRGDRGPRRDREGGGGGGGNGRGSGRPRRNRDE